MCGCAAPTSSASDELIRSRQTITGDRRRRDASAIRPASPAEPPVAPFGPGRRADERDGDRAVRPQAPRRDRAGRCHVAHFRQPRDRRRARSRPESAAAAAALCRDHAHVVARRRRASRGTRRAGRGTAAACRTSARQSPPRRQSPGPHAPACGHRPPRESAGGHRRTSPRLRGAAGSTTPGRPATTPSGTEKATACQAIDGVTRTNISGVS